eukprot:768665-Hanusia_phi.AAC.5
MSFLCSLPSIPPLLRPRSFPCFRSLPFLPPRTFRSDLLPFFQVLAQPMGIASLSPASAEEEEDEAGDVENAWGDFSEPLRREVVGTVHGITVEVRRRRQSGGRGGRGGKRG